MKDLALYPSAFVLGVVAAFLVPGITPPRLVTRVTLWVLIASVGVLVGSNPDALRALREAGPLVAVLPAVVLVGSVVGGVGLALVWPGLGLVDAAAVSAGVGYYSLTSVLATELAGETLGVLALLANLMREAATLALAPVLARRLGPVAPIAAGGATAMDTTLPVIVESAGETYGVVAIYSGGVLTAAVPVVVGVLLGL